MKTQFVGFILIASVLVALSTAHAADTTQQTATDTRVALTLSKQEKIKSLEPRQLRVAYRQEGTPVFGLLQYSKEGISWLPAQAEPVKLPHALDTLVAADGRHLLQYGDSVMMDNPLKTDLYFIDVQGKEVARVIDRYGPQTSVVMADDGHVAVGGPSLENPAQFEIALYTATGEPRFQSMLAQGRRASLAVPAQGQAVAAFTSAIKNPLSEHSLKLFDASGKPIAEHTGLGILQKLVSVANGSLYFVQAKNRIALISAADGALRWTREADLRLVSPFGAATNPDGTVLFLAAAEWDGKPRASYQWRVEVRDVASGEELTRLMLPGSYPGSMRRIFLSVTNTQLELLAGDERIVLDWRQP